MAHLPEQSNYDEGVYQLELTDPVVGGPNGVSNAPLRNLANRTRWLKEQVTALMSSKAGLESPALTGTPTTSAPGNDDNTDRIASTSWVRGVIGRLAAPLTHVGSRGEVHGEATTTDAGFMSAADKAKLDGIARGAQTNAVTSVAGRTGDVALDVADVSRALASSHAGTGGTAHAEATTSRAGFMSAADKAKLDGIARGAQANAVTSVAGRTGDVALLVSDVSGAAPASNPTFSGRISVAAGTITDLNHERGAKVYVPAKKIVDMTAPEAVSKYALEEYAAPKVSPTFTGNPTAPTPLNTDNGTRLATTAWVRNALTEIAARAGFSVETRQSVTPGVVGQRPITSTAGECGIIKLPSFLGGIKFVWANCRVRRNMGWEEVQWHTPLTEVFTGGASAFGSTGCAATVHPIATGARISLTEPGAQTGEVVYTYAWAIGR